MFFLAPDRHSRSPRSDHPVRAGALAFPEQGGRGARRVMSSNDSVTTRLTVMRSVTEPFRHTYKLTRAGTPPMASTPRESRPPGDDAVLIGAKTISAFLALIALAGGQLRGESQPTPTGASLAVVGDSYAAGVGADAAHAWERYTALDLGWSLETIRATPGSGYVNPGAGLPYEVALAVDPIPATTTQVIVQGGFNDMAYQPARGGGSREPHARPDPRAGAARHRHRRRAVRPRPRQFAGRYPNMQANAAAIQQATAGSRRPLRRRLLLPVQGRARRRAPDAHRPRRPGPRHRRRHPAGAALRCRRLDGHAELARRRRHRRLPGRCLRGPLLLRGEHRGWPARRGHRGRVRRGRRRPDAPARRQRPVPAGGLPALDRNPVRRVRPGGRRRTGRGHPVGGAGYQLVQNGSSATPGACAGPPQPRARGLREPRARDRRLSAR